MRKGLRGSRLAHPRLAPALVHPLTALGAGLLTAVKRFVNRLAVTIRYGPGRPYPRTHGPRRPWPNLHERGRGTPVGLDRGRRPPHLKIRHRLFAARCVAPIIDRGRLLPPGYRPKPRLCRWRLGVTHNASDYWSAPITEPHVVVVLVPMIRATAFACGYKNKLRLFNPGMYHR
jgi:hypothetical protein